MGSRNLSKPKDSTKYMKFNRGFIVRQKASTTTSYAKSNISDHSRNRLSNQINSNEKFINNNIPISFKNIYSNETKSQTNNFSKTSRSNNQSFMASYYGDHSTDYSYSYYPNMKNQTDANFIKELQTSNNTPTEQTTIINSVLLKDNINKTETINKYFNLKHYEDEKISQKINKRSNYRNRLFSGSSTKNINNKLGIRARTRTSILNIKE